MRRATGWLLLLLLPLAAACGSDDLGADDARQVALDAFAAAGLDAAGATAPQRADVDVPGDGARTRSVWLLSLDVEGEEWTVGVDPGSGRIVRTFEPPGSSLTDEQVLALGRHSGQGDRGPGRAAAVVGVAALGLAGYGVLRRLALRDRDAIPEPDPDD